MSDSINHAFFSNLTSTGSYTDSLPNQTKISSKKKEAFKKGTLDRLEQIAEKQYIRNQELVKFYQMVRGELVYSDYALSDVTNEILELREEAGIPAHAKHYDFLGLIINQIKGEYPNFRDLYQIATNDEESDNEFMRDQEVKVKDWLTNHFQLELKEGLLKRGVNVDTQQQFQSEEEKQQYLQQIQAEKDKLVPPERIQENLLKSFKTVASEWAEQTLERDWTRDDFNMEHDSLLEIEDYMLTGRWFRHYHIGYDYYKPERWHPCEVFFSEDLDIRFPQQAEYVGRLTFMSPSNIVNRWGDKIPEDTQKRLLGFYNEPSETAGNVKTNSLEKIVQSNFGQTQIVPFEGYHDYDLTLQMQNLFDTPFGETVVLDNGEQKKVPAWFSPLQRGNSFMNNSYAKNLRSDIIPRNDLIQTVECYWRSWRKVGVLNYTTEDGFLDTVFVTDDLLPYFLKENEIKVLRNTTLEEVEKNPQPNTVVWDWIPEVRWGVKIKAHNSFLNEDLYLGGDPAPVQMKGSSEVYDVQLPVAGYIGDSMAKKLHPYIIKHNIVMNQIYSLLEKELGTFFLFDIKYLPSEYKNNTNVRESLEQMYDIIQDLGIVPVDTSRANTEGSQTQMNAFSMQNMDFTAQINNRMQLATQFKLQALEQIGITPQRLGVASQYSTAEGIKQGMTATYAQTESIFNVMSVSSKKATLLHLTASQYAQKNYKDYFSTFTKSDGSKAFIALSDPNFPLRNFGLTCVNSSTDRKELELYKQTMLQINTANNDMLAFAEIVSAKSMTTAIDIGRRNRMEAQAQEERKRQHESEQNDKLIQADKDMEALKHERAKELEHIRGEYKLEEEQINSMGRASLSENPEANFDRIDKATQNAIDNNFKERDRNIKEQDHMRKVEEGLTNVKIKLQELNLKKEELRVKEKGIDVQERVAIINPS